MHQTEINYIIADNQVAFVQGRSMFHNILTCDDQLKHYNRKTTPTCLVKINHKKAYGELGVFEGVTRWIWVSYQVHSMDYGVCHIYQVYSEGQW